MSYCSGQCLTLPSMFACNNDSIKYINCVNNSDREKGKQDTAKHLLAFIQLGK